MTARRFEDWGPAALVLLALTIERGGALALPFFADDFLFLDLVRKHPGLSALFAPDPIGNFFRPVSRAAYFGVVAPLTGESSFAFHLLNLALLALALVLFLRLARIVLAASSATPTAQALGAIAGASYLALHYAFDVPVMWVSGSQDLLAIAFALGALVLVLEDRGAWGGLALGLALLCKESVAPCALVAIALGRALGDPWSRAMRRAAPLLAVTALWGVAWWAVRARGGIGASPLAFRADSPLASLAHAVQVALGLEFRDVGLPSVSRASLLALALAVLATLWVARRRERPRAKGAGMPAPVSRRALLAGLAWAVLASTPVAVVAPIWSAYFYGFALCGLALALAGALAGLSERRRAFAAVAVGALGLLSAQARAIDGFADRPGAWSAQSHVNRHYFERAMNLVGSLVRDLKVAHPTLPPGSTLYFANIPSFSSFQVSDGPLVRWAYRDPSLEAHFLSQFGESSARGPIFVMSYDGQRLHDSTGPTMFAGIGTGLVESGRLEAARKAFRLAIEREPASAGQANRWLPWLDRALAGPLPTRANPFPDPAVMAAMATARTALAAGDSARAIRVLSDVIERADSDAAPHALMSDLAANIPALHAFAIHEAFIARTLAPDRPESWRRWAILVGANHRDEPALAAIERWRALAGPAAKDPVLDRLEAGIRERLPGGAVARGQLRQR